jgi:hypothetical protein
VGVNYNYNSGNVTGNASVWSIDQKGNTSFNPSISIMLYPEHTTNFFRGQGFRSNDAVLNRFVNAGNQQGALDYFGFEGTYDPTKPSGGDYIMSEDYYGATDPVTGSISYGNAAFSSYDNLYSTAMKEQFHNQRIQNGVKPKTLDIQKMKYYPKEALGFKHAFRNSGLYSNSSINNYGMANSYWFQSYGVSLIPNSPLNFIYKIPRLW